MKKRLHISATFDQPALLQNLVERLAYRHYDIGYSKLPVPTGFKALETSSTEAYVSGAMQIELNDEECINMPFITCFIFTCIKEEKEPYQLIWSSSCN